MVDIFDSHDSQFVADDDLPHIVTPTAQIIADIKQKLSSWLDELDNHVPLDMLKLKADAIIHDIREASAWPSANDLAIELAVTLDSRFEQIGLGKTWYNTLMFLFGAPNADK